MFPDKKLLARVTDEILELDEFTVESSFPYNIEITLKGVQKGVALKRYANLKSIKKEEVMVFGDSKNDISMMTMDFAITYAMDNALNELKKCVKYTTESNCDNGVAKAIKKHLL